MKRIKKILASLMVAVMVLTAAPLSGFVGMKLELDGLDFDWLSFDFPDFDLPDFTLNASAKSYSGTCGENLTWSLDTETGELIIDGTGNMENYASGGSPWNSRRSYIKSVTFTGEITSIGDYAFLNCTELTEITIPESVKSIGVSAIRNCSGITNITIPDSVTSIGSSAFRNNTALTSIVIPDSVTDMGTSVFRDCSALTSADVGDNVTVIGDYMFCDCTALTEVTIGNSVEKIGDGAFKGCTGLENLTVPAGVDFIDTSAFSESTKLFLNISKGSYAETYANNKNVPYYYVADDSVSEIISVTVSSTLSFEINTKSYTMTVNCTGDLPASSSGKFPWAQYKGYVKNIIINDGCTGISANAFKNFKAIKSITIPDSVTSIGGSAFYGCTGLISITIPDSVTSIGASAFYGCTGLTSITIPDSVTSIGASAFYGCTGLTSVTIPDSVTSIGASAFYGCTGLTSITIPDSVTSIGESSFNNCKNMTMYLVRGSYAEKYANEKIIPYYYIADESAEDIISVTVTSKLSFEIDTHSSTLTINCSGNMMSFTAEDIPWAEYKGYVKHVIINNGCKSISTNAFKNFNAIKSITIPDSVTSIGSYAFYGCTGLTSVTIGNGATSIGSYAFYGCTGLTSVTIPDSVTSIGGSAFYGCTGLTSVTIGNGVTSIGSCAFYDCTGLTSVTIPDRVTSIGSSAFSGCTGLTNVTIGDSVTSIGGSAFYGCRRLKKLTMPISAKIYNSNYTFDGCTNIEKITLTKGNGTAQNYGNSGTYYQYTPWYISREKCKEIIIEDGVTGIGSYTFYGCTGLTSVTIPDSVASIGEYAFYGCEKIGSLTLSANLQSVGNSAFTGCVSLERLKIYNRSCTFGTEATSYYTTIVGYAGSTAETYADENGLDFVLIGEEDHEHVYSNRCDNQCNICGYINVDAGHTFSDDCDSECNYCGFVRTPNHTDNNNDGLCDGCDIAISDILIGVTQSFNAKAGETVYIKFVPANSGVYTFYSSSSTDTYGYIFNADKNTLASDDDSGGNRQFSITYTFKSGTVYYLGVKYYNSSNSGEIPVTIRLDQLICDHNNTHDEHQDSTCSGNGYDKVVCDDCGETVSTTELPLTDHALKKVVDNPTCEEAGAVIYYCSDCSYAYVDEHLDPLGHSELVWVTVKVPSTRNEGIMNQVCPACGEVFDTKTVPAISLSADSTANIDFETNTISGFDSGSSSVGDYLSATNNGYTFTCDSEKIATGTVITLTAGEDTINEFEAVIFGDTNGDSWYDGQDAIIVDCLANGMLTKEDVGEAVYMAADCNHDGVIDQADVALLNEAGTLLANVDQSKPAEVLLETSSVYVEYLDLIDQSPELDIEDETDTPDVDAETEDTTPEQDAKVDIFKMIMNFIKSIFEMLLSYIPMPLK